MPGPSGQKKEKSGERESKKDNEKTAKSSEKPERKRQNSPRRERIKFFKEKGTTNAKLAEQVDVDCQLLVYGLPESRFQWRDRERALQKLVTNLSSEEIGDHGINLEQKHIIGAYHTSNKDGQMITRLTVDSNETKENIRRAALKAKRWGAKSHTVFLRDTLPETPTQKRGRSSSNEDTKTSKKRRTEDEETPRSSRSNKEKSHSRSRPEGRPEETQTKMTTESEKLEKIKLDRLEARRAKLEHQDREDRATQEQINKQGKRQKELERVTPKATIQTFQALNEKENKNKVDWRPQPTKTDKEPAKREAALLVESENESETQEGGIQAEESDVGSDSGESIEVKYPDMSETDYEYQDGEKEELETEGEEEEGEEEEIEDGYLESSPERRVTRRNPKTAARNKRRRLQRKLMRDQETNPPDEDDLDTKVPRNKKNYRRR